RQNTPSERDPLRLAGSPDTDLRLGHLRDITPRKELSPAFRRLRASAVRAEPSSQGERLRGDTLTWTATSRLWDN
ncbi:MAG TPA: hypothetical protein VJX94_02580, partial [Stellaceae bacterium]|nr:hypothetical protein [Stellaceae bacterium]